MEVSFDKEKRVIVLFIAIFILIAFEVIGAKTENVSSQSRSIQFEEISRIGRGTIEAIDWSPTEAILATGGSQGVWLYTADLQDVMHFDTDLRYVTDLAWSPDGTYIANSNRDGTLQVWNAQTGNLLRVLKGHQDWAFSIAWNYDGTLLASTGGFAGNEGISIWEASTGNLVSSISGHDFRIVSVSWSPKTNIVASASWDGTVKIWDALTGIMQGSLRAYTGIVDLVEWSPNGKLIATVGDLSGDSSVIMWDSETYQLVSILGQTKNTVGLVWSPEQEQVVIASPTNRIQIWDVSSSTYQNIFDFEVHSFEVFKLDWDNEARLLAIIDQEMTRLEIWDSNTGTLLSILDKHSAPIKLVAWNPVNNQLVATDILDPTVRIWNAPMGDLLFTLDTPIQGEVWRGGASTIEWSPDGTRLASGYDPNTVSIWRVNELDISNLLTIIPLDGSPSPGSPDLSWSPDGDSMIIVSGVIDSRQISIWDTLSGEILRSFTENTQDIDWVAWNPNGKYIAFSGADMPVEIWDATTYQPITFETNNSLFTSEVPVAWNPEGSQLAGVSCNIDKSECSIWIWEVMTGIVLETDDKIGVPNSLVWSPDGSLLASDGNFENAARIWDGVSRDLLAIIDIKSGYINSLTWNRDGIMLAGGGTDGSIYIWSIIH